MSSSAARERAARLLKKAGHPIAPVKGRDTRSESRSSFSFRDDQHSRTGEQYHPPVRYENTYRLTPTTKFPTAQITNIVSEILENYLNAEKYEPELCRKMTMSLSELIRDRVKSLNVPRYKFVTVVHMGQLLDQGLCVASRCLWDNSSDSCASFEYRNNSLYAVGMVYGIYQE